MKVEKRKVKIFADSTCDLAPEQIKEYEIQIIPLCILLDEKSYYDGEELLPDEIYRWADANKKHQRRRQSRRNIRKKPLLLL